MCGISGIINAGKNADRYINIMNNSIVHRGPDDVGIYWDKEKDLILGHRRLSILDLSETGHQPMISHSGNSVIVLNGEIYNYLELKKTLIKKGIFQFKGTSDTEVLLEYIELFGLEKALDDMNGMYAFCYFDRKANTIYLARDRGGEKPLFYGWISGMFIFSSELKAIHPFLNKIEINDTAVEKFLLLQYIPAPYTIYKKIYKLKQGEYLQMCLDDTSHIDIKQYWNLRKYIDINKCISYEEAIEELKALLYKAVKKQTISDVPYGAFLSGGIDSSLIAAMMRHVTNQSIKTYSIGFEEAGYDEAPYAREVAEYLGSYHTERYFTRYDVEKLFPKIVDIYDEPFADISAVPTCLLSQTAKKDVTVCLTGDAGDELFLGYSIYQDVDRLYKKYPARMKNLLVFLFSKQYMRPINYLMKHDRIYRFSSIMNAKSEIECYRKYSESYECKKILKNYKLEKKEKYINKIDNPLAGIQVNDFYTSMSEKILTKVDRAAMLNSLETRVPLLDREIIEFALSIPTEYKYDGKVLKKILKDLLYQYVPQELVERPKQGFGIPISVYLKGNMRDWAESIIYSSKWRELSEIIDESSIHKMWRCYQKDKDEYRSFAVWRVLMLGQWIEKNM